MKSVQKSGGEEAFSHKKGEDEVVKKEAKAVSPELLAKASEMKSHIDSIVYSGVMGTFLKDSSITFQVGRPGSGFYFLASGSINLDPLWFLERGRPKEIVEWAMYHEGRHANDRREDREAFDKKVDLCIEKAELFLPRILEKWEKVLDMNDDKQKAFYESLSKKVPVEDGTGRKIFVSRAAYGLFKTYFSTLFVSLDDVWVNHGIYEHFPHFHPSTSGGELVRSLYREVLFAGTDYTKDLKSFQYAHFLLRKSMLPDEEATVSEEVRERLGRSHKVYGQSYESRLQLLEGRIMPSPSIDTRSRARNKLIEESFMKDFDELIALDIKDWKPEYKEEKAGDWNGQGEGSEGGDGGQNNTSPFDAPSQNEAKGGVDQLSPGEQGKIDSFIQGKENAKNEGKRRSALSPGERAKEDKERRDIARLRKVAISRAGSPEEEERLFLILQKNKQQYERYCHKVENHLKELSLLWKEIIGKGIEYKQMRRRFQTKGELNVETLTPKWQAITSGTDTAVTPTVFDRNFKEVREHSIPEEVRVYFLPDISKSMDDGEKLEALRTTTVLLLESFRDLQSLALTSSDGEEGEEVCKVTTKVIAFNESAHIVKDNKGIVSFEDVEGVPSALVPSGGTLSSVAYKEVLSDISSLDGEKLADGRIKVIVIELTDGATGKKEESRDLLSQIKRKGRAVTAGILIQEGKVEGEEEGVERDRMQKMNLGTLRYVHGEGAVAEKIGHIAKRLKVIIEKAFEDTMI